MKAYIPMQKEQLHNYLGLLITNDTPTLGLVLGKYNSWLGLVAAPQN